MKALIFIAILLLPALGLADRNDFVNQQLRETYMKGQVQSERAQLEIAPSHSGELSYSPEAAKTTPLNAQDTAIQTVRPQSFGEQEGRIDAPPAGSSQKLSDPDMYYNNSISNSQHEALYRNNYYNAVNAQFHLNLQMTGHDVNRNVANELRDLEFMQSSLKTSSGVSAH